MCNFNKEIDSSIYMFLLLFPLSGVFFFLVVVGSECKICELMLVGTKPFSLFLFSVLWKGEMYLCYDFYTVATFSSYHIYT